MRTRQRKDPIAAITAAVSSDGPLEEQMSLHIEERLKDYLAALVSSGRCLSKNSRVRALVAADYAWGEDEDWCEMVASGMAQYEERFGARL